MGFDVSALANYTKENEALLVTSSVLGAKTAALIRSAGNVMVGVKSSEKINIMETDAIFQDGASCGFNASGSTTFTQRTVTPGKIKVNEALCPKDLEAKYESEKKEAEIGHLKTQKELEEVKNDSLELKAQKNRNLLTLSILAGLILLAGVGILFRSNKSRRKANDLLNSKNEEIESSNVALQSALTELSDKNREIIDSINYATYIQRATYRDWETDRKSTRLNSSHLKLSRMPSSA